VCGFGDVPLEKAPAPAAHPSQKVRAFVAKQESVPQTRHFFFRERVKTAAFFAATVLRCALSFMYF
jgi:hypothetical protein